jgi:hypothetical protein
MKAIHPLALFSRCGDRTTDLHCGRSQRFVVRPMDKISGLRRTSREVGCDLAMGIMAAYWLIERLAGFGVWARWNVRCGSSSDLEPCIWHVSFTPVSRNHRLDWP